MSESTNPLADLILVRLAMPGKKPPASAAIHKDLAPLVRGGLTKERVEAILQEFRAGGLLPAKGQALTDAGRARALAYLGLQLLPAKCKWATVKAKFLIPKALGLTPWSEAEVARVGTADKLAARLLKEKYQLPVSAEANLSGVLESLVCKLSGFTDCVSLKELTAKVISRELKAEPLPTKDAAKVAPRLLLNVTKNGIDGYRLKVLGGTIDDRVEPTPIQGPVVSAELQTFAAHVLDVARKCPTGWFGNDLVFISHVWKALQHSPSFQSFDLNTFKTKLLAANRAYLLVLSRADLVQAMDPNDVKESETSYLNSVFHFIRCNKES